MFYSVRNNLLLIIAAGVAAGITIGDIWLATHLL